MTIVVRMALVLISLATLVATPAVEETAGVLRYEPAGLLIDAVAVLVLIAVSLSFFTRRDNRNDGGH